MVVVAVVVGRPRVGRIRGIIIIIIIIVQESFDFIIQVHSFLNGLFPDLSFGSILFQTTFHEILVGRQGGGGGGGEWTLVVI